MTYPKEAVEAVAAALWAQRGGTLMGLYECDRHRDYAPQYEAKAMTILDQIAPILTARAEATAVEAERERCAKIAESSETPVFKRDWGTSQDAAAISAMMSIAAAIREQGGKT